MSRNDLHLKKNIFLQKQNNKKIYDVSNPCVFKFAIFFADEIVSINKTFLT